MPGRQSSWRWPFITWRLERNSWFPPGGRSTTQVEFSWWVFYFKVQAEGFLTEFHQSFTVFLVDFPVGNPVSVSICGGNQEPQLPARVPVSRSVDPPKPASKEPTSEWRMPSHVNRHVSPEVRLHSLCAAISVYSIFSLNKSICPYWFSLFF